MNWISRNFGMVIGMLVLAFVVGALLGFCGSTSTYLLDNPTEKQIKALYDESFMPGWDLSLSHVTGSSSLIELKVTHKWHQGDDIRRILEDGGYSFIER